MTVLAGCRVVCPGGVLDPGWVGVAGGRIVEVGLGSPPKAARGRRDLGGAWVLPGFIDLHMHGGGGHSVTESEREMAAAVAFHRSRGTTRTLVSALTAPVEQMCAVASWAASLTRRETKDGNVLGSHLEGPFLAPSRRGAQDPDALLPPDRDVLARLLDAGDGTVRTMTVAPELPGGLDLVRALAAAGVVPAVGHTEADHTVAAAAFDAGARLLTHTFNAMRGLGHRDPGPIAAAADRSHVTLELINDGEHVHGPMVRLLFALAPGRVALITDAMAAAGAGDGEYLLGRQRVRVRAGRAVLEGGDSIAGSTLTMADAVRRAVLELGLPIRDVAAAAATAPARLLKVHCGQITAGYDADLVVLDDDLQVTAVMADGQWCW